MARTKVTDLYADFIDSKPVDMDLSEIEFEWWEAVKCDNCGHPYVLRTSVDECPKCGTENYVQGPVFNYSYPIKLDRVPDSGQHDTDLEQEAALALIRLPLCVIEHAGSYYLNLTGGGMDMSWEICEAYMVLGYLPPVHFAKLPPFAGAVLDARRRWILSGMSRALRITLNWTRQRMNDVKFTRAALLEEKKRMSNG